MNQGSIQAGQVDANSLGGSKTSFTVVRVLAEAVLIAAIAGSAYFYLRWSARLAGDMVEDSAKYAVAASNLRETGRFELTINNRGYPSWGGLGYGLLIVPSYWIWGPSLGNAIYTQTTLAVLICLVLYISVRPCLGRLPAAMAALLVPLYQDFSEYARIIDTDIPAAFFLALGLLIFVSILDGTRYRSLKWLMWGLCGGWGTAVRTSTLPAFLALTVALVFLSHRSARETLGGLLMALMGSLPLMIPLLWYNHHYCGSCFRDPHAFWESREFDNLSHAFGLRYAFGWPGSDTENLNYSGNLIFYGREIISQFSRWPTFVADQGYLVRGLTFFLSGVTAAGVGCVYARARTNVHARHLLWYAVVGGTSTLLFYVLKSGGNVRYIVPVIPFAAIFTATAVVDIVRWFGRRPRMRILVPVFLFVVGAVPFHWWQIGGVMKFEETVPTTQMLEYLSKAIESNAVVIGFNRWELINHLVIKGTSRQFAPLKDKGYFRVQPRAPAGPATMDLTGNGPMDRRPLPDGAVDLFDYSAVEDPTRIERLIHQGVPVYVIRFPSESRSTSAAFRLLERNFQLLPWQRSTVRRGPIQGPVSRTYVVLWKLELRTAILLGP